MNYQELIEHVAEDTRYTKRQIRAILRSIVKVMQDALFSGRDVHVEGLGHFLNAPAAARSVMDPRTKQQVTMPATRRIKFVPSRHVKHKIRESQKLFVRVDPMERFGLGRKDHGEVRSGDRSEEGPGDGEEGGGR